MGNALNENLEGRYVVLREDAMAAAYRDIKNRVFLVRGGFGASSFTSGSAIYGTTPVDGEKFRMEGYDVERFATDEEIALVTAERCPVCGQPDNCGDCTHEPVEPPVFHFLVTVTAQTRELAEQVMSERVNHDEALGFDYTIDWGAAP